ARNDVAPMTSPAFIDVSKVSLVYGGSGRQVRALHQVDLVVEEGQFLSLVGPSGCGKTTLLKAIGAILQPTDGTITIDGGTPEDMRRSKAIGHVFQEALLLPWKTVAANITFLAELAGKSVSRSQVSDLAEFVGIGDFLDSYPHELSGGMRQRVALCRALI